MTNSRPTVVVITGLSGAGKSTALRTLEDLGFFCTDNLPTVLAPQAVELCEHGGMSRVALGIDVRVRAFLGEIGNVLSLLESGPGATARQRDVHVIYIDASDATLLHRFSETRRRHPLDLSGQDGAGAVLEGIRLERERLAPLRGRATRVFDTTLMSAHELRRAVIAHFGPASEGSQRMTTRVVSFGFKYGAPVDADLVLDVRFLENPYFVPHLKALPGTDPSVEAFVMALPETREFLKKAHELLSFVMPKYEREGKSYLTIGIGCTGGRHRSVVVAEHIARALSAEIGHSVGLVHRDVQRTRSSPGEGVKNISSPPPAAEGTAGAPIAQERASQSELKAALSPLPQPVHQAGHQAGTGQRGGGAEIMNESAKAVGKFTIVNTLGLHARAATKLVQLASKYPCEVEIANEEQAANGKSVMGVLLLCGSRGTTIEVRATGLQAEDCVKAIGELIAGRFGEPN